MKIILRGVLAFVALEAATRVSYWLAPDDERWLHYAIFFTVGMPLLVAAWKLSPLRFNEPSGDDQRSQAQ